MSYIILMKHKGAVLPVGMWTMKSIQKFESQENARKFADELNHFGYDTKVLNEEGFVPSDYLI